MRSILAFVPVFYGLVYADPTVTISNSRITYQGVYKDQTEAFLGIKYGQDTSGSNRFKPPRAYVPTTGRHVYATDGGPACPQQTGIPTIPLGVGTINEISEDCLRLNVVRPNGTTSTSRLPVMVFIHGGSFIYGYKDDPVIAPGGLILQSVANGHPVMHVSMNYRLGVFGFAQSQALTKEGSANAGVKDHRLALEWVAKNIAAFGGDPNQVTLHGQSSGGLGVGIQTLAYGASKPSLFQRAIFQSQALEGGITGNFTQKAMRRVAKASGCNGSDLQSAATVQCLRNLSMENLLDAEINTYLEGPGANIGDNWLPVVDGDFLPAAPSELISTGRFHNVSAIMGWCDDDANVLIDNTLTNDTDEVRTYFQHYLPGFTKDNVNKLLSLYPSSGYEASFFPNDTLEYANESFRASHILRDILFVCQDVFFAQALTKAGNDVYFYNQNQTVLTPILDALELYKFGVTHTSEFAYAFGNLSHYDIPDYPYHVTKADYALLEQESRSWSSFAALGKPSIRGKNTLSGWQKADYGDANLGVYIIGGPTGGYAGANGDQWARKTLQGQRLQERCAFLNQPDIIKQQLF